MPSARLSACSRGIVNMFAGMCSKPMATKAEIGNQMPTILPAMSWACPHRKTAMQAIQLQLIPVMVVMRKFHAIFFSTPAQTSLARKLLPSVVGRKFL